MGNESQNKSILLHMLAGGMVTPLHALATFGSLRLSGRIYDIKNNKNNCNPNGYVVQWRWIKTSTGKRVKEFRIDVSPNG